jgi:diguanylate cyclase (GGDEF)-like protein
MREILETSIRLERHARDMYRALSQTCADETLASRYDQLADDERIHIDWWADLLMAWGAGLLPDIVDEHSARTRLEDLDREIAAAEPADYRELSIDDGLDLAVSLEYRLLDPVFGELLDLVLPGSAEDVHAAYVRHIGRVVDTLRAHYSRPALARFHAEMLTSACARQGGPCTHSSYDQLTGLYNRRELLCHVTQELAWSRRYGRPLGVVVIDLDHFKDLDTDLGHQAADQAIGRVARTLKSTLRASDTLGRFGGDEFLVLAPETDGAGLEALMDRLVGAVRTANQDGAAVSVTAGAAWAPGGLDVKPDTLIAQADRSMYAAKAAGRDRAGMALSIAAS